jgi:hypothetical protein
MARMPDEHDRTCWPGILTLGATTAAGTSRAARSAATALRIQQRSLRRRSSNRSEKESWQSSRFTRGASSFRSCDDIMIHGAEKLFIRRNLCAIGRRINGQSPRQRRKIDVVRKNTRAQTSGTSFRAGRTILPSPAIAAPQRHPEDFFLSISRTAESSQARKASCGSRSHRCPQRIYNANWMFS